MRALKHGNYVKGPHTLKLAWSYQSSFSIGFITTAKISSIYGCTITSFLLERVIVRPGLTRRIKVQLNIFPKACMLQRYDIILYLVSILQDLLPQALVTVLENQQARFGRAMQASHILVIDGKPGKGPQHLFNLVRMYFFHVLA